MADSDSFVPDAKKARGDNSVDVHAARASAPAEQQTGGASAPSQQRQAEQMFGECFRLARSLSALIKAFLNSFDSSGEGMQGPAGVRTGLAPGEAENRDEDVDLEPGAADRPEGIVGPSGASIRCFQSSMQRIAWD